VRGASRVALAIAFVLVAPSVAAQRPPAAKPKPKPVVVEEPAVEEHEAPREVIVVVAGGLTAEQVARRASSTSYGGRAAEANVTALTSREGTASLGYAPRFLLTASYTRLSNFTSVSPFGTNKLVFTQDATGTVNPQTSAGITPQLNTVILNQYVLSAQVTVPLSDYVFRTKHSVAAAELATEAAGFDVTSARASSWLNGKTAYYNWVRTRGAVVVAELAVAVADAQLKDAKTLFEGGNVTSADVLRAETAVAAAQQVVARAQADATNLDWHIRTVIHAPDEEVLVPGEPLDGTLSPVSEDLKSLIAQAFTQRPEAKGFAKSAEAERRLGAVARAGKYPVLNAVGDVTYANPNYRKFPVQTEFFPSWSAGAVLTWSPNDFALAGHATDDALARAAAYEAQAQAARDVVLKEVVEAYTAMRAADASVESTSRQLESALGGYKVARQLYIGGRNTATAVLDASTALTQARYAHLNARAEARIARAQLEYAMGRTPR
jgi:outer membrane protein